MNERITNDYFNSIRTYLHEALHAMAKRKNMMRPYDKYFPSKIYISNNGNKIQNKESKIQLKLSLSQAGYTSHSGQYGCHFLCDTPDYPVTTNNILCPIN